MDKVGTYEIELTVTTGKVTQVEETIVFQLNILNPCIDPDFVLIDGTVPDEQRYVL